MKNGDVLQFTYVGYVTQSITITGQTSLNVGLVEDSNTLDEVVVIGYWYSKKESCNWSYCES